MKQKNMGESMTDRLSFETEQQETFIVCRLYSEEKTEPGLVELLRRQELAGIAGLAACQTGVEPILRFRLHGRVPLSARLRDSLSRQQLQQIIGALATICSSLEDYLLDPQWLILDENYLFVVDRNENRGLEIGGQSGENIGIELEAVYLPLVKRSEKEMQAQAGGSTAVIGKTFDPLGEFLRRLLPGLRLADQEGLMLWAGLMQFVHSRAVIAPAELLDLIVDCEKIADMTVRTSPNVSEIPQRQERREDIQRQCRDFYRAEQTPAVPTPEKSGGSLRGQRLRGRWPGLKTIWSKLSALRPGRKRTEIQKTASISDWLETGAVGSTETMLLHDSYLIGGSAARLVRERTHECFLLDKPKQRLGKGSRGVDILIENNASISRCHAEVRLEAGGYTLTDLASTNHTYVNGRRLSPHKSEPIRPGDVIRLADEDFYFREGVGKFTDSSQGMQTLNTKPC